MLVIVLGARGVRGLATQSNSVLWVSLAVLTVCMVSHSLHVSVWCECSQTGSSPQWSEVEVLEYINGISMVEIQKFLYTFYINGRDTIIVIHFFQWSLLYENN